MVLPPELAYRFPTNVDLVLQTHFHPNGKVEHEEHPALRAFLEASGMIKGVTDGF